MFPIILFVLSIVTQDTRGLVGYDCGARSLNITTVSLLDVGNCDIPETTVNITKRYLQLLQINDFEDTHVIQCKIQIHRTVYYCGWNSHIAIVKHAEQEYLYEISKKTCIETYKTGTFYFDGVHVFKDIKINQTTSRPVLYAGYLNSDGKCNGAAYSDAYGSWESVVVQGTIKITVQEQIAPIKLDNNQIILRSGTKCTLSDETCIDIEGGYTFWELTPTDTCKFNHYGILYEGYASKIVDKTINNENTVYSLTSQEVTFGLLAKTRLNLCGYTMIRTEHPKLLIFETVKGVSFANKEKTSVNNLDMFAYVNSKFVFVERFIKGQIKNLYRDIITHQCNQERQIIKNSLALAVQAPDQFAYNLMKGPGYMAVTAGEVVHIVKCIPVDVKVLHGETCYNELKVVHNNVTKFMTPRTHILKSRGTEINCNSLLPSFFFFNDIWYKFTPKLTEAKTPITIQPLTKMTWNYQDATALATSGIYTEKDLEELKDRIMFSVEQPAVINQVAREIHGHPITDNEGTIGKLLNENAIEKLVENTWNHMWNKFITFGSISAGVFAILMVIQGIKMLVDTIMNGYALHRMYGWSVHLLGAVWNSLATFLLYIGRPPPANADVSAETPPMEEVPLTSRTSTSRPSSRPPSRNSNSEVSTLPTYVVISEKKKPKVRLHLNQSTRHLDF